jgi:ubiquinone biosynthesis protein Coq4
MGGKFTSYMLSENLLNLVEELPVNSELRSIADCEKTYKMVTDGAIIPTERKEDFFEESLHLDPQAQLPKWRLYEKYSNWMQESGYKPLGKSKILITILFIAMTSTHLATFWQVFFSCRQSQ